MTPRNVFLAALGTAVLVLMAAPAANAHPAAPPPEYVVRLLHDCNDDWLGHDLAGAHGHDLIALDIQEHWDPSTKQDMATFRLIMNGGFGGSDPAPVHRAEITFKAAGTDTIFELSTADNEVWTGTFPEVRGPFPQPGPDGEPDGGRFYVEGTIPLADLGVAVGDSIGTFFVQGYAGQDKADHMPGGGTLSGTEQPDCSADTDPAVFERPSYALAGPSYYAGLETDTTEATVNVGDNLTITLTQSNLLFENDQTLTLTATGPINTDLTFHTTDYFPDKVSTAMAADSEGIVHLYVVPGEGSQSGTVSIDLTTDLGGHVQRTIDLTVIEPEPPEDDQNMTTTPPPDGDGDSQNIPAPGAAALTLAILAGAFITRRRVH